MANYAIPTPIGQRNQAARLEKAVFTADGQGGNKITGYTLRAVVYVLAEPLTSREALQAKQLTGVLSSAITMPFRSDLLLTDRILLGKRTLHVQSYQDPSGRKVELRVICGEVQA